MRRLQIDVSAAVDGVSGISEHETFTSEAWAATVLADRGDVIAAATVDEIQHTTDPIVRQFIEGRPDLELASESEEQVV